MAAVRPGRWIGSRHADNTHRDQRYPSAVIAPTAAISGEVRSDPDPLGAPVMVREQAVLRSISSPPLCIGNYVLV